MGGHQLQATAEAFERSRKLHWSFCRQVQESTTLIELKNICRTYQVGHGDVPVLKGISLKIAAGEYVALMGSSGSGKTTLMNVLGSLDHPSSGDYYLDGIDVSKLSPAELAQFRGQSIGFIFQNFNLLPRTTALDNVLLPTLYASDGRTQKERVEYATDLLLSLIHI